MKHRETEKKGRRVFRLRYKLFLTLSLGLLISICLLLLIQSMGYGLIERKYMDEKSVEKRLQYYESSLENYVRTNGISSKDTARLSQWVKTQGNIYLILYDGDTIIYESGWWDEQSSKSDNSAGDSLQSGTSGTSDAAADNAGDTTGDGSEGLQGENSAGDGETAGENENANTETGQEGEDAAGDVIQEDSESDGAAYDIEFSDGIYGASIIEFSELKWYNLVNILSWGVFILMIFTILLLYNRYVTNRIVRLANEASVITGGKWDAEIYLKGNDEIAKLAEGVDDLRNSMTAHFKREKAAWKVNSELITSMSHDIRTPLTALIGYLDILDGELHPSEEDCAVCSELPSESTAAERSFR